MKKTTNCYALTYIKAPTGIDTYIYRPLQITEGMAKDEYDVSCFISQLLSTSPMVVGQLIRKEQLKEQYPDLSEQEALGKCLENGQELLNDRTEGAIRTDWNFHEEKELGQRIDSHVVTRCLEPEEEALADEPKIKAKIKS